MSELERKILAERCRNCERQIQESGKLCAWRSLSNDHCYDGMSVEAAHEEIARQFGDTRTKIERGQI